jgi:hypothetical protein
MFSDYRQTLFTKLYDHRHDILIIFAFAVISGCFSFLLLQRLDPAILNDTWFEADIPRVFDSMTSRTGNHYRTKVHPLFSLIAYPPVFGLKLVFGVSPRMAVNIVITAVAMLWISSFYLLLRLIRCHRLDAILFTLLMITSATAMCWTVVPETYIFGSLSILLALITTAISQRYEIPSWWYTAISSLTMSFTITNWMAGIFATFIKYHWKRALQITVNAFCAVVILWGVQKYIFPTATFFLGDKEEIEYVNNPHTGGPLHIMRSFFFHTMIIPQINISYRYEPPVPILITQPSPIGSASTWGLIAVFVWIILLGLGLKSLFFLDQATQFRKVLALTLLGQFALHMLYGDETFLYSLHYGPLLVLVASLTTLTRDRIKALVLVVLLLITAGVNNAHQLGEATKLACIYGQQHKK